MAVNLHHLRWKIAGAAVVKGTVGLAARVPGVGAAAETLAERLEPEDGEPTGSYRGIAAGLLRDAASSAAGTEPEGQALVYDPVAGLVPGPQAEPAPDVEALRAHAEAKPSAGNFIALAAAYRKSYIGDFGASAQAYERAFELNPDDLRAVEGILVSGARSHYDWPRIWSAVQVLKPRRGLLKGGSRFWDPVDQLFTAEPPAEAIRRTLPLVEQHAPQIRGLHQLLIETIAARLQFLGAFAAGTQLRRLLAGNRVKELRGIPLESALWLKHLLGAYAYLEQDHKLATTARRPLLGTSAPAVARQVRKLTADAALWAGDPAPLHAHAQQRDEEITAQGLSTAGEQRMRELVAGRRVAVVGPAAAGEEFGELIDSYDVVVRTNLRQPVPQERRAAVGSRTDVSYYAGLDLVRDYAAVQQLLAAKDDPGSPQLAVTRPHCLPALPQPPDWLRFPRFEFGLYFRGAPQGIQRMLYDLLQFAPAELALFHADFYAGTQFTATGYRQTGSTFGPHSQANDPVVMHDLSFEFRFTQRLVHAGMITPHGTAAEMLNLSECEYLRRLERGPLGPGT